MPREKPRALFDLAPVPRRKRRVMMHVVDAGPGFGGCDMIATFECKCGYQSDWEETTESEFRRGKPCPKCNQSNEEG